MRGIIKLSIAAAIIGIGSLLISYLGGPSQAAVDNTRDCDTVAIFYCGSMSESEFHQKWNNDSRYNDHAAVFNAFGIKKEDVRGMVEGVVWRDGRVTLANGTVVATGATTAGRWNNPTSDMTRISGTSRAYKMSTRHFVDEGQTAMIKMVDGQFKFAVIKSCGNPVVATPKPPKPEALCVALANPVITDRTRVALKSTASVKNGATISEHIFTVHDANGTQINQHRIATSSTAASTEFIVTTPGTYTAKVAIRTSLGDIRSTTCEKKFTIETPPPTPVAKCTVMDTPVITNRTNVAFKVAASVSGGATIHSYVFNVTDASGKTVATRTVNQATSPASTSMVIEPAGTYTVKVTVKTSLGDRTSPQCEKKFTVTKPKTPGISIDKKVDGVEHKKVGVNVQYDYQIRVINTGDTDLKNAVITDNAPKGVTFLSASKGTTTASKWTYTIPELKKGAHMDFTITAKVPEHLAGTIKNTVCVDTPDVPGSPDDCDDATVEVPKDIIVCVLESKKYPVTIKEEDFDSSKHSTDPKDCDEDVEYIKVCIIDEKKIVTIDKKDFDDTKHTTDLSKCEDEPKTPPVTPPTPPELPKAGAADSMLNGLGLGALVTSGLAYVASRKDSLI